MNQSSCRIRNHYTLSMIINCNMCNYRTLYLIHWWWWSVLIVIIDDGDQYWSWSLMMVIIDDGDQYWSWSLMMVISVDRDRWWWWSVLTGAHGIDHDHYAMYTSCLHGFISLGCRLTHSCCLSSPSSHSCAVRAGTHVTLVSGYRSSWK